MEYIDLVVLCVLIIFVIIYSKRFQTYMFGFGAIDILFRILNTIKGYIPIKGVVTFINTYVPSSIPGVISKYTSGMVCMILLFVYAIIMAIFLYYIVKIFTRRRKI